VSNETGGNISTNFDPTAKEAVGTSKVGAILLLELTGTGPIFGSWAVTAE
jgi:hypothetical protein